MERYFMVQEESKYMQALNKYMKLEEQQRKFVNRFFKENNIEAYKYDLSGTGFMNTPFNEDDKNEITLRIIPTENDINNFNNILCKADEHGLCQFKKSSKLSKDFAQQCIDNKIPINLHLPRVSDYFESLSYGFYGCSYEQFEYNNKLYLKVESRYLKENDTPKGFIDIKASEFYIAKEKEERENK
ncbi:hypothetical protein G8V07_14620 [Clostridium botulinum D/C]|uniref:hypothetical protein n=1 Tax=Clostridium botulinum TaxID=1491 RepID=UPI001E2E0728|nr:hypothetical protein [Clostridium botulinum]MCD3321677.1 hypothetical protein [Clostridium botulinum D/C]MCD3324957.1 hypothetical protein [Clostridium botulinum D/C]MCD3327735.1 hypothetical protein [Clostridium botulinum D/C]